MEIRLKTMEGKEQEVDWNFHGWLYRDKGRMKNEKLGLSHWGRREMKKLKEEFKKGSIERFNDIRTPP